MSKTNKSTNKSKKPSISVNESDNLKAPSNQNLATNKSNIANSPVILYNPGINMTEIKNKIMSSNYCYVKQDLESFFSACLGCCADFFKYKVYVSQNKVDAMDKINNAIFRVTENEDCCMRINFCCSKICKPGSLYLYPIDKDDIFGHFSFPYCNLCHCCCEKTCECCYYLGPPYRGYYGRDEDNLYGKMAQRFHWCSCVNCCYESHRFFDLSENSRFILEKPCCQLGGFPCPTISGYYPLQFNILFDGQVVGNITRSAKACCCGPKLYYFEISFPTMATFEERMLLIGFTLREHYLYYSQIIHVFDNF